MQTLRWIFIACLIVGPAGCEKSKPAVDKAKLVGVWELTKTTGGPPPPAGKTICIEFLKDGKMKDIHKESGKPDDVISTRPYQVVDGNMLKITNPSGGEAGMAIEKLTDTELVIEFFGEKKEYKKK